jgi:hypothetical protein
MIGFECCVYLMTVCKQHECTGSASADHEDMQSTPKQVSCVAQEDAVATQATARSSQASSVEVQASQLTAQEAEVDFAMNFVKICEL